MNLKNQENNLDAFKDIDHDIELFSANGYTNVRRAEIKSTNDIFIAEKNGQECFIKKYKNRDNDDEKNKKKFNTEIACYQNLPQDHLLTVVEVNEEKEFLVLENAKDLEDIEKNEASLKEITGLYLNELVEVDASFLPEINWEQYNKLFDKLKTLENINLIPDADKFIKLFNEKKGLVGESRKVFSYHDYNLSNIKTRNEKLIIFDFELACRDNAMYDMATLYIEIQDDEALKQLFQKIVEKSDLYNKELFDLMLIRRAADVVYGLRNNQEAKYFEKNKNILDKMYEDK